jgi:hypothetical protein
MEQSFHPPLAAAERAALRSARRFARAEVAPALPDAARSSEREVTETLEDEELRTPWSRASIPRWRQQSVPHSGAQRGAEPPFKSRNSAEEIPSLSVFSLLPSRRIL